MIALPQMRGCLHAGAAAAFDPLDLSPVLYLDAETLTGGDGTQIATWADSSLEGNDATQGTSGAQPKLYNSVLNGKKVVRFDGTDDYLSGILGTASSAEYTIFAIHKKAAAKTQNIFSNGLLVADGYGIFELSGNRVILHGAKGFLTDGAYPLSTWEMWTATRVSATASLFVNGASQMLDFPSTDVAAPSSSFYVGGDTYGNMFQGDIATILVYDRALTTEERQNVESFLAQKYGITLA